MHLWQDGRLVPAHSARVSPLDSGFRLGDGVFSTLRVHEGVPAALDLHVARTVHDAAALGITGVPADRLREAVLAVAEANRTEHPDLILRILVTRGSIAPDAPFGTVAQVPSVLVLASPSPPDLTSATVATVQGGRRPAAIKSTSWAWSAHAIATARAAGADTALLLEGVAVLEAAAANVIVVHGDDAITPDADGRLLPGVTRALLLDADVGLREGPVTVADLEDADEVMLTSAVRGVLPVVAIDDRTVGTGQPGPVAARLQAALDAALDGHTATHR